MCIGCKYCCLHDMLGLSGVFVLNTFISGLICCTAASEHISVDFCFALIDSPCK